MEESLDARSQALARSRTYHLLGNLFLRGLTDDNVDVVGAVEPLAEHFGVFRRDDVATDLDEAAADHQHVFGFNVFPFEGVFLDSTAQVGGATTRVVLDAYQAAGFPIAQKAESGDHIGVELNFLGFLCRREAAAEQAEKAAVRRQIADFVDDHVGRWLPAFVHALNNQRHPFFSALGELTLEVVADHRDSLDLEPTREFELPDAPPLLDDPRTGLRDIARFLLVPAFSGLYLSRDDIRGLSGRGQLPAGFGARRTMMNNLLRSAADYDGFHDVLGALLRHCADTQSYLDAVGRRGEVWRALTRPWTERLDATADMLRNIGEVAGDTTAPDPLDAEHQSPAAKAP
jgi:TorA maturation chaperone TorD